MSESFDKELILYHTTQTFHFTLEKKPFENIVGKGENAVLHFMLHSILLPICTSLKFYHIGKGLSTSNPFPNDKF